eukprot:1210039-Rhodomonas_salina.2
MLFSSLTMVVPRFFSLEYMGDPYAFPPGFDYGGPPAPANKIYDNYEDFCELHSERLLCSKQQVSEQLLCSNHNFGPPVTCRQRHHERTTPCRNGVVGGWQCASFQESFRRAPQLSLHLPFGESGWERWSGGHICKSAESTSAWALLGSCALLDAVSHDLVRRVTATLTGTCV